MLARRIPTILPPLDHEESLEVTKVYSSAGLGRGALFRDRPFRAPHHTASAAGLLGGGQPARPGEISLAHRGVLFLDELPEFDRRSLEALRQVLEDRRIVVSRARGSCVFPAHFQLVAAANPCPCGFLGSAGRDCRCDDAAVSHYAARISGPLLDRIDLHVALEPVPWKDLDGLPSGPASQLARERVVAARRHMERRLRAAAATNAEIPDEAHDALVDARHNLIRWQTMTS